MPAKTPTIGETWELRDLYGRSTRGIVAEITDIKITLVALTGARINVPASRFPEQWTFVAAPPKTSLHCSRCKDLGILRYQRGVTPDFVCPKHLPIGTLATLHTPGEAVESPAPAPRDVIQCPECGSADPVEDVRLGRLERGKFGWWTCPLCSSRWGLISEPNTDTDNKGRWYADTVAELTESMSDSDITGIEFSNTAWYNLLAAAVAELTVPKDATTGNPLESGTLFGIAIQKVTSLTEGSVLVRARRAPPGSAMKTSRKPIQRIGGVGNRSGTVAIAPAPPPTPVSLTTMVGMLDALGVSAEVRESMGVAAEVFDHLRTIAPTAVSPQASISSWTPVTEEEVKPAPVKPEPTSLPTEGAHYFQRRTGKEVEIVRVEENEGRYAVAIRDNSHTTIGSTPYILWLNDFNAEYVPAGRPSSFPVPEPLPHPTVRLNIDEEWYSFRYQEYVRIESVDLRKMTAVVKGGSTGRTRNAAIDDFAKPDLFSKVERVTAHQRLMMDDD